VPEGRIKLGPLDPQRHLAAGGGLFDPLTMEEIDRQIALLKQRNLGIVGVSGHDSSDEVIEKFRREFGTAHRYIRVGEEILIGAPTEFRSGKPPRSKPVMPWQPGG
jgi:7,8-dihydropterin-6-yl-methyl-4-(beta-D-ribofuranosyl)aminobenzene 5'-phosphate synthase